MQLSDMLENLILENDEQSHPPPLPYADKPQASQQIERALRRKNSRGIH